MGQKIHYKEDSWIAFIRGERSLFLLKKIGIVRGCRWWAFDHQRENQGCIPFSIKFGMVLNRLIGVHVAPIGCIRERCEKHLRHQYTGIRSVQTWGRKKIQQPDSQHQNVLNERQANWVEYNSTESSQRSLLINRGYE